MKIDLASIIVIVLFSVIFGFLCILGIVIIIKKTREKKENNQENTVHQEQTISRIQPEVGLEIVRNIGESHRIHQQNLVGNIIKINGFCEVYLKPKTFGNIKNSVFNSHCPIDLENFKDDTEVCVTQCFHAFHYICLKNYFIDNCNNNEFKCPLCKRFLFTLNES